MNKCFIGIDPSFAGLGLSIIDTERKEINFRELKVELGSGTFVEVTKASDIMFNQLFNQISKLDSNTFIGMEIPPVQGMYAVKLWALDTHLYRNLINNNFTNVWLFNVPYLKFINKKYEGKKDTKEMMTKIVEVFKDYGYSINTNLKSKNGKDRKLTSNQLDSFIYAVRMFVKYSMKFAKNPDIVSEILNINENFLEEKETILGKKL